MDDLSAEQIRVKRLRWRCRRGTTELERLLGRYLKRLEQGASEEAWTRFERFLVEEDRDLQRWLLAYEACPVAEFSPLVDDIRALDPA